MGPENHSEYSLTLPGNLKYGIPDFIGDGEAFKEYVDEHLYVKPHGPIEFEVTFKWDPRKFWEIVGLIDWTYTYCPNRKVANLMRYGKNKKIRNKNFHRAVRLIGRLVDKE